MQVIIYLQDTNHVKYLSKVINNGVQPNERIFPVVYDVQPTPQHPVQVNLDQGAFDRIMSHNLRWRNAMEATYGKSIWNQLANVFGFTFIGL